MSQPDKQPPDPAVAQDERRVHPRHSVQVQLELKQEGSDVPMRLTTSDLSRNGCYVEMIAPLSVGIRVQATLWLGEERVRVRGCVVTRHPQYGNGIMFLVFEDNGQQILRTFLAQLRIDN
jgi:hypothetical protein